MVIIASKFLDQVVLSFGLRDNFARFASIFDPWSPNPQLKFTENRLFSLVKSEVVQVPRRIGDKIPDYEVQVITDPKQISQLVASRKYREWLFQNQ